MAESTSPEALKELGNAAVKNAKYEEGILHYTHAIKLDPNNYTLYSNRSFAFLKVHQYHLSMEDAQETIRLNPSWPKGFFRRGEIEFATKHYDAAKESYERALTLKPDDVNIFEALERTKAAISQEAKADNTMPWIGASVGMGIGIFIALTDFLFTDQPTQPLLMAFVSVILSIIGYVVAHFYRYYVRSQSEGLLEPPADLFGENQEPTANNKSTRDTPRYTKSQARQRYKKGKL